MIFSRRCRAFHTSLALIRIVEQRHAPGAGILSQPNFDDTCFKEGRRCNGGADSDMENPLTMPPRVEFNERKATQVAARFLVATGRKMPYISLLKLMYFMDREALLRWGVPVTNDRYYSLDNGPILSRVMNLMTEESYEQGFWSQHISSPSNYLIELIDEAGNDQLSKAEERLIDEIIQKNRGLDRWQLRDKSHKLPEWKDPHGSSIPIEIEDILKAGGIGPEQREAMARELEGLRKMQALAAD